MEPTSDVDIMELKQYINKEIAHLRELRHGDKETLEKQAKEYERRLTELNHAHARSQEDKAQFLTIAVYEAKHQDLRNLLEAYRQAGEKTSNQAETNSRDIARLTNTLTWITRTVIGSILVAIVALLLRGTPMFPSVP